jgi:guanosine-3',5'-bis(diphosphate) 3'-pyrophosphohydrolase
MDILSQVEDFANRAHGDQQRKFEDAPYIVHLVRVMKICKEYSNDPALLSAALLHDVLEDTPVTRDEIADFLTPLMSELQVKKTMHWVHELTDQYTKANYPQFNRRKRKTKEAERLGKASPEAQTIKYADIIDNSLSITNAEDDFIKVYLQEAVALLWAMKNGNSQLRERAMQTVGEVLGKHF